MPSSPARRLLIGPLAVAVAATGLIGCASSSPEHVFALRALNESGVTGTVSLAGAGNDRTRVVVEVDPAGNPDMPAHIHPGTCENLTPQPKYGLENVRDGHSTTEVATPLEDLLSGSVAVNIHLSNDEMDVYTACAELTPAG